MLDKIANVFGSLTQKISGQSKITEKNIEEHLEEIKTSLLEADVNLRVVRRFINHTKEEAMGTAVLRSVNAGQQFVKIVHDRLVKTLGDTKNDLLLKGPDTLSVILMAGLQGSGKTTTTGKLAKLLKSQDRKVMLVACDIKRPAAVEQLKTLAEQVGVSFYHEERPKSALKVATNSLKEAKKKNINTLIVDTAGRLEIDEEMMGELKEIQRTLKPVETLYVADAMTGQSAATVAKSFNEQIEITGGILTKFDSDTRGGAALSFKGVTGKPIKFIGVGEKLEALEPFYPDRIASRILGMGDILSLVEKAQKMTDESEAKKIEKKMQKGTFSLTMYLEQIRKMKEMGGLNSMMKMMPGMANMSEKMNERVTNEGAVRFKKTEAIICSMTKSERGNHRIIGPPRRKRIAKGSGTTVGDVNKVLKEFEQMRLLMKKATKMEKGGKENKMQQDLMNKLGGMS